MASAVFYAFILLALGSACCKSVNPDPSSADELSRVIDAAVTRLAGRASWWHDLTQLHEYHNAVVVYTCTPDEDKWRWPETDGAHGLWRRVLESGELKVAGVQWSQASVADYITDPLNPTGFWPEYLQEVVDEINSHYHHIIDRNITINRVYYPNSVLVVDAVAKGEVDMSEPYYYIAGFHDNDPRIEALHISCVTVGSEGNFITRKDLGITTWNQLYDTIKDGNNRDVGFIGEGNANAVRPILPTNHFPKIGVTNGTDLANQVVSGQIIAGYVSEGFPPEPERFNMVPTGIISPRGFLFRKDEPSCDGAKVKTDSGLVAGVLFMTITVVMLVGTLSCLIVREKRGHPVFGPAPQGGGGARDSAVL